ncbi:MAG: hypothetical protein EHM34_04125 [Nitrosopumilales archaeon]|nr:MAG: hypothetical protein EHM34_04125 [Nitrosopumilales archaeon]
MKVFNYEPTAVIYEDNQFTFVNREAAEDFITDLEDYLTSVRHAETFLLEDVDYQIFEIEMYLSSSEAITEFLGL